VRDNVSSFLQSGWGPWTQPGSRFPVLLKLLSVGYLIALLWLLLSSRPLEFVPPRPDLVALARLAAPAAHFLSFTLLALSAVAARWSMPRRTLFLVLVAFAVGTELLQGLIPRRTPELVDCLQNLAGILAGGGLCWLAIQALAALRGADRNRPPLPDPIP